MRTALVLGLISGRAGVCPGPLRLGILVQGLGSQGLSEGNDTLVPGLRPIPSVVLELSSTQPPTSRPDPASPLSHSPTKGLGLFPPRGLTVEGLTHLCGGDLGCLVGGKG